jgi:hypothetical protein
MPAQPSMENGEDRGEIERSHPPPILAFPRNRWTDGNVTGTFLERETAKRTMENAAHRREVVCCVVTLTPPPSLFFLYLCASL